MPIPLNSNIHDRESFCCGVTELDQFIKTKARKEAALKINQTFVLTLRDTPSEIVGYYTLSNKQIATSDLPEALTKKLPNYNTLGATLLGRLAVAEKYQRQNAPGQKIGSLLINDAKLRSWIAAQSVGSYALIVDVLVGEKGDPTGFYLKYDFQRFPNDRSKLFLPMATIEKTLRAAGLIE